MSEIKMNRSKNLKIYNRIFLLVVFSFIVFTSCNNNENNSSLDHSTHSSLQIEQGFLPANMNISYHGKVYKIYEVSVESPDQSKLLGVQYLKDTVTNSDNEIFTFDSKVYQVISLGEGVYPYPDDHSLHIANSKFLHNAYKDGWTKLEQDSANNDFPFPKNPKHGQIYTDRYGRKWECIGGPDGRLTWLNRG
jgi:hypothetical protein